MATRSHIALVSSQGRNHTVDLSHETKIWSPKKTARRWLVFKNIIWTDMRTSHWAAALPMPKENEILIREMTSSFRRLVMEAGFDLWKMTHHCNRSGLERKRKDQIIYLKNVKSHCNYRLVLPERNLVTKEDCE